ncbi:hypothetical protein ATZ33_17375 [Enterococcus silesiacus]|uniref:SMODS and SLOG-associating 2TM effector domain-containing protein n=1 Tax=Enterococcus silesiacus TaxID=332949 RepID=A0A0S3KFL1_9ENTE|nr:hypothetical protein [Enterococcus silesiacus]ALS03083.1 hypothetical protein ATZ33_17375 [Enterococcus silesiacus]OJG93029.1 hypothetical protein RV15_GL002163 [Enterococcus silesiacus]
MKLDENQINILNIGLTAIIAIFTSILTSRHISRPEKQQTARLIFEKCYSPIYSLVEYQLFSKEMTKIEVNKIGNQIIEICDSADNYYFPSVKIYAERMAKADSSSYMEQWEYFSERFSMRYDNVCREIGVPIRNNAYRLNRRQYKDNFSFYRLFFKNNWLDLLFIIFLITLIIFMSKG